MMPQTPMTTTPFVRQARRRITGISFDGRGKYFPEGFQLHGHLVTDEGAFRVGIFYDLVTTPPECLQCRQIEEISAQ